MNKHCCKNMSDKALDVCNSKSVFDENKVIYYFSNFREYGIPIRDGKSDISSYILIEYCPWCGQKLPASKRIEWFEELEKIGYDNPFEQDIPQKFKNSDWYNNRN